MYIITVIFLIIIQCPSVDYDFHIYSLYALLLQKKSFYCFQIVKLYSKYLYYNMLINILYIIKINIIDDLEYKNNL